MPVWGTHTHLFMHQPSIRLCLANTNVVGKKEIYVYHTYTLKDKRMVVYCMKVFFKIFRMCVLPINSLLVQEQVSMNEVIVRTIN